MLACCWKDRKEERGKEEIPVRVLLSSAESISSRDTDSLKKE
jgi:hypothetical protein